MISVYTDEDVDVLIKPLLKAKGFIIFTTLDEGMLGKGDKDRGTHPKGGSERAVKLKSIFLTHNRIHFEKLSFKLTEQGKGHFGIIIATRRNIYELARRVSRFLELHDEKTIKNQLWYI